MGVFWENMTGKPVIRIAQYGVVHQKFLLQCLCYKTRVQQKKLHDLKFQTSPSLMSLMAVYKPDDEENVILASSDE